MGSSPSSPAAQGGNNGKGENNKGDGEKGENRKNSQNSGIPDRKKLLRTDGASLLHLAASLNDVEMCAILIDHGIDVDIRDADGRTPIHIATIVGAKNALHFLVERGGNVNAQDNDGNTPLHYALFGLMMHEEAVGDQGKDE